MHGVTSGGSRWPILRCFASARSWCSGAERWPAQRGRCCCTCLQLSRWAVRRCASPRSPTSSVRVPAHRRGDGRQLRLPHGSRRIWTCAAQRSALRRATRSAMYAASAACCATAPRMLLVTYNWGAIEWAMANILPRGAARPCRGRLRAGGARRQIRRRVLTRRLVLARSTVVLPSRTSVRIAHDNLAAAAGAGALHPERHRPGTLRRRARLGSGRRMRRR